MVLLTNLIAQLAKESSLAAGIVESAKNQLSRRLMQKVSSKDKIL